MIVIGQYNSPLVRRACRPGAYWFDGLIGHADSAAGTAVRSYDKAHRGLVAMTDFPARDGRCAPLEALPALRAIQQPFNPPA